MGVISIFLNIKEFYFIFLKREGFTVIFPCDRGNTEKWKP